MGATLFSSTFGPIDIFSVYCPRGSFNKNSIVHLFDRTNKFFVGGDFNEKWESNFSANSGGTAIFDVLIDFLDKTILAPTDLGARIDPSYEN